MANSLFHATGRIKKLVSELGKVAVDITTSLSVAIGRDQIFLIPAKEKLNSAAIKGPFVRTSVIVHHHFIAQKNEKKIIMVVGLWDLGKKLNDFNDWLNLTPRAFENYLRDHNNHEVGEFADLTERELNQVKEDLALALFKLREEDCDNTSGFLQEFGPLARDAFMVQRKIQAFNHCFGVSLKFVNIFRDKSGNLEIVFEGIAGKQSALLEKILRIKIQDVKIVAEVVK